ncbi:kinesin-domain-containing protein [Eremomyces bilateralis CBS 781.70]|uniref:Kinesin-domain-containing protein n=1 Tax=Eremomyces bilateralis CBS 781.70 TaxID=1392243 RepID=A0A6G1GFK4_9PEZI|nr:kinesin-domain-containing protein [Eremomyces bilateralis CBS 781.70]KAF1816833.1 kinesin-domain-containing protein [Eremomyces bilateralis CBS 781.70]
MPPLPRPSSTNTRRAMRPPPRPVPSRSQSVTPSFNGRQSPAGSVTSTTSFSRSKSPATQMAGSKRKEREFDQDSTHETNINVVVRCRGRNEREVKENSGVVVSTDGIKGKSVELSMGPSALSNKTYHFDKVFSPAADQIMVFDEVVAPILDEVLDGFNCTIFAYGQTGTGKTYTMSGDISDILPLPDAAGIIPRALHSLFNKLDSDEGDKSVKCSFIELYNEELRDLLSVDDRTKLKIYEENTRKGHAATLVQGMEEKFIESASKGIELLREGSHKRQVAATKCNDLSSRSHTVFTVTVYVKRSSETGEELVSAGKLNLVDLAGSENIQRSGAENKRATEAGLINKSLLTLGRVINALVDRGSHIPYRESKLTRLLQDSLGGQTKTCIIATLSPAKSNLEETISSLDYAFRAKNIRNKPQVNQVFSKKTLLKEFTGEIEKLRSELIATRQRNGVYLTSEIYEGMTIESESRRILSEEQRDKIETMEVNLRNKVQELFSLTTNFNNLKKDNEASKAVLDDTKNILENTEIVLGHTRQSLAEERVIRNAHQHTELELAGIGASMIGTLERTTEHINGLDAKLRRRSDLHNLNRDTWASSQDLVSLGARSVEELVGNFREEQDGLLNDLAGRMRGFVADEIANLEKTDGFIQEQSKSFHASTKEVMDQTEQSRSDLNAVLGDIETVREDAKSKLGSGLDDLSRASQRISAGILTEIDGFQTQLHSSYASLGKDFRLVFDELLKTLHEQESTITELRTEISEANARMLASTQDQETRIQAAFESEKQKASEDRTTLLAQISSLVAANATAQETRFSGFLGQWQRSFAASSKEFSEANAAYGSGMDAWAGKSTGLIQSMTQARDSVKGKIKGDFAKANEHTETLRTTTSAVHDSTSRIVEEQKGHMDSQLQALDGIVGRIKETNDAHHKSHLTSLENLASTAEVSYSSIGAHFKSSLDTVKDLDSDMTSRFDTARDTLSQVSPSGPIIDKLQDLASQIEDRQLEEYKPTGNTPKRTTYEYPASLPRTQSHDLLIARARSQSSESADGTGAKSPNKAKIFADADSSAVPVSPSVSRPATSTSTSSSGLKELDVNVVGMPTGGDSSAVSVPDALGKPAQKRQNTNAVGMQEKLSSESKLPMKRNTRMTVVGVGHGADRENVPLVQNLSASVGHAGVGRRLRSQNSS